WAVYFSTSFDLRQLMYWMMGGFGGVDWGSSAAPLMTWAVYFSTSFDLRQLMYWMMGGFGGVDWGSSAAP
ncbi:hypothetical protein C5739_29635, partial [Klebsiella pneumoniae]